MRGIVPVGVRKMKKRDKKEREWKREGENERGITSYNGGNKQNWE